VHFVGTVIVLKGNGIQIQHTGHIFMEQLTEPDSAVGEFTGCVLDSVPTLRPVQTDVRLI
jgi:hypothetical protein